MASKFEWNGVAVAAQVRAAIVDTVVETAEEVRDEAMANVRVKSGRLQEAIELQQSEPYVANDGVMAIEVGVDKDKDDVRLGYGAIQEKGPEKRRNYSFTPYIMPALDVVKSTVTRRLKRNFARRSKR